MISPKNYVISKVLLCVLDVALSCLKLINILLPTRCLSLSSLPWLGKYWNYPHQEDNSIFTRQGGDQYLRDNKSVTVTSVGKRVRQQVAA